ncbi:glycosyltransferase family 2 protein [Aurantimonas sp. VKM B-3413]|uniref:glycosyltransferase family 2 protein n=1 Tax=Aurantimonas sp. VKM B-3413 TaxID=2779401 RepID=UPI001E44951B|nr:glycosyltransferase family 2 protein [Aurantimonas sp. VKM B-3413]MCB8836486.1 glycosyltransferase family 2 protein [Aurantimonas sp. VKM B-3413]
MSSDRIFASFRRIGESEFDGFVLLPADPDQRFVVELLLDGEPFALTHAETFVSDLAASGYGDGCYGFSFVCNPLRLTGIEHAHVRIANSGDPVGEAIDLAADPVEPALSPADIGSVRWTGGLRLEGWRRGGQDSRVRILFEDQLVAEAVPDRWIHIERPRDTLSGRLGFQVTLPQAWADGVFRRFHVETECGEALEGSPVALVAYRDGLTAFLLRHSEGQGGDPRTEFFDRVLPNSVPLSDYREWASYHLDKRETPSAPSAPVAVALVGEADPEPSVQSLRAGSGDWVAGYFSPDGAGYTGLSAGAVRPFLDETARHCETVLFAMSGTRFRPQALACYAAALQDEGGRLVYGDIEVADEAGDAWPLLFGRFDLERFLEQGYAAHLFACSRADALAAVDQGARSLYEVFASVVDASGGEAVVHLPGPLATRPALDPEQEGSALARAADRLLESQGIQAHVTSQTSKALPAVRVMREVKAATLSVIIPTRDRRDLLEASIRSLKRYEREIDLEIIVVDNGSREAKTLSYLDGLARTGATVIRDDKAFNYARLNNRAVESARGEVVCLLNNDTEFVEPVFAEMLSRLADPTVGAVGVLLTRSSDIVQHGGVVLGPHFGAAHAFEDRMLGDPGYGNLLKGAHEVSAVTAACLMTRRADYLALGGLDEIRFPVAFNDVDYCLRLREQGKRIVFTPHVHLLHHESASRGSDDAPERRARAQRELVNLRTLWGEVLADDPYYSPLLSLGPVPYSGLAAVPRRLQPLASKRPYMRRTAPFSL